MTLADASAISGNTHIRLSCRRASGTGTISWRYSLDAAGLSGYTTISSGISSPDYTWSSRTNDSATPYFFWCNDGDGWVAAEFPAYAAAAGFDDVDGWHIEVAATDSVLTFVSQAFGNDGNAGTSANAPLLTLRNVATYVPRDNYPDFMLLRRGDTWATDQIRRGNAQWHGRSSTEPAVICAYGGGARPVITTDCTNGYEGVYFWHPQHLHIQSLNIVGDTVGDAVNKMSAVFLNTPLDGRLDDCRMFDCAGGATIMGLDPGQPDGGTGVGMVVHRCQLLNANQAVSNGHSQGVFADRINGLVITECVLDHNGWDMSRAGHEPDQFNHNIYITHDCGPAVVTDCVSARASANGMQMRSAGTCERNLMLSNPISIFYASALAAGAGTVVDNVCLDSRDIDASNARGWGIDLYDLHDAVVSGNLLLHNSVPGVNTMSIHMVGPIESTSVTDNIAYRWGGPISFGTTGTITTLTFARNDIQHTGSLLATADTLGAGKAFADNRYYTTGASSSWVFLNGGVTSLAAWLSNLSDSTSSATQVSTYPNPEIDMGDYLTSIGVTPGADPIATFLTGARANRRGSWDARYTNQAIDYFRAGFGLAAVVVPSGTIPGVPTSPSATVDNSTQITFSFVPSPTATSHEVRIRTHDGTTWTETDGLAAGATSHVFSSLDVGGSYDMQARARNAIGASDWTTIVTATTTAPGGGGAGSPPTIDGAVPTSPTTIVVSWTPTDGGTAAGYQLEHSVAGAASWTTHAIADPATHSHEITGLTEGSEYDFRIKVT